MDQKTEMTVAQFMTACLDQDEAGARQAAEYSTGRWEVTATGVVDLGLVDPDLGVFGLVTSEDGRHAAHIARHDPAAVLADIQAKRHIVNLWLDPAKIEHWGSSGRAPDEVMSEIAAATMIDEVVRTLAEAYDSRPGYRDEWRIF